MPANLSPTTLIWPQKTQFQSYDGMKFNASEANAIPVAVNNHAAILTYLLTLQQPPTVLEFNPQSPGGYVGPNANGTGASQVFYIQNGVTDYYTAKQAMTLTAFPSGIPAPTTGGADDPYWALASPPAAEYQPLQIMTVRQFQDVMIPQAQLSPARYYRLTRYLSDPGGGLGSAPGRAEFDVVVLALTTTDYAPSAWSVDNTSDVVLGIGTYDLATDTFTADVTYWGDLAAGANDATTIADYLTDRLLNYALLEQAGIPAVYAVDVFGNRYNGPSLASACQVAGDYASAGLVELYAPLTLTGEAALGYSARFDGRGHTLSLAPAAIFYLARGSVVENVRMVGGQLNLYGEAEHTIRDSSFHNVVFGGPGNQACALHNVSLSCDPGFTLFKEGGVFTLYTENPETAIPAGAVIEPGTTVNLVQVGVSAEAGIQRAYAVNTQGTRYNGHDLGAALAAAGGGGTVEMHSDFLIDTLEVNDRTLSLGPNARLVGGGYQLELDEGALWLAPGSVVDNLRRLGGSVGLYGTGVPGTPNATIRGGRYTSVAFGLPLEEAPQACDFYQVELDNVRFGAPGTYNLYDTPLPANAILDPGATVNLFPAAPPGIDFTNPLTLSAAATLQVNKSYRITGTGYALTLPDATAAIGARLFVSITAAATGLYPLTGSDYVLWSKETIELLATPDGWKKIGGEARAMSAELVSNLANQSALIVNDGNTPPTDIERSRQGPSGLVDTVNYRLVAQRSGKVSATGSVFLKNATPGAFYQFSLVIGSLSVSATIPITSDGLGVNVITATADVAAGSIIRMVIFPLAPANYRGQFDGSECSLSFVELA